MFWYVIVGGATLLLAYVIYTLLHSYGSDYADNSIEAFIDYTPDDERAVSELPSNQADQYHRQYGKPGRQLLILYGTEYGCSEQTARELFDMIEATSVLEDDPSPWQPRIVDMKHHGDVDLQLEQLLFVCVSTAGDGVPPTDAREFYQKLLHEDTDLHHLSYTVLALGDSNYPHYCRAGRMMDSRLEELGAYRLEPRHDVDQEDSGVISNWVRSACHSLKQVEVTTRVDYLKTSAGGDLVQGYSRNKPFMATLKVKRELTMPRGLPDDKETIHCEFDLTGSDITWTAGDALGVYPLNNPGEVDRLLAAMKCSGQEDVKVPKWTHQPKPGGVLQLREAFVKYYNLKHVKPELVQVLRSAAALSTAVGQELDQLLQDGVSKQNALLHEYLQEREVADVLEDFSEASSALSLSDVLCNMKPLLPRYYSISSSPKVDRSTACVTAAIVRYSTLGRSRTGVTTTFLQDRLTTGLCCPVFISQNPEFRLPAQPGVPVIMVGPGTGIAPFRAFVQERVLLKDTANTRLYFGCRHSNQDFLYREELEEWNKSGKIILRTAFSRDRDYKVYVQDLLREDGLDLWQLLSECQAHFYICGDAKHMAHDVHKGLLDIAHDVGGLGEAAAERFYEQLEREGRYQKDVWVT